MELFKSGRHADAKAALIRRQLFVLKIRFGTFIQGSAGDSNTRRACSLAIRTRRPSAIGSSGSSGGPALVLPGRLMLDDKRLDEARTVYKKALELDPTNTDIWRQLGAMALEPRAWPPVRAACRMRQGFADLHQALALVPRHIRATEWLGELFQLRGSLTNSPADLARAGELWRKAQNSKRSRTVWELRARFSSGTWPVLRDFASFAAQPMMPPPPLRDLSAVRPIAPGSPGAGSVGQVFMRASREDAPPAMLANPAAQERNLLTKVEPAVNGPGAVRLDIVIGRDGCVKTAKVISGEGGFADAAGAAVLQWTYRPTLSNGEPVEVRTEVDVH